MTVFRKVPRTFSFHPPGDVFAGPGSGGTSWNAPSCAQRVLQFRLLNPVHDGTKGVAGCEISIYPGQSSRSHVTKWLPPNPSDEPNRQGFPSLTLLPPQSISMCKCVNASCERGPTLTGTGTGTPSLINLLLLRLVQIIHAYTRPNWTVAGVVTSALDQLDQERKHFEDLKRFRDDNVGFPLSDGSEEYLETFAEDHGW